MLTYLQRIEWFIGLVLLQVLVLNHMHINGYATPSFLAWPAFRLVTLRDSAEDFEPGVKSMGVSPFFRYILLCTFLFCSILLVIDTFSFFNLPVLLLKILTDASITIVCILCAEAIRRKK